MDLGDVEVLCELLMYELLVVGWLVDRLCGTTCPHMATAPVPALILAER